MVAYNLRKGRGFTFIEVLFALFMGLLLLSSIYFCMVSGQRASAAIERKVIAQQDTRALLEMMTVEITMASYNPNLSPGIWLDGPAGPSPCKGVAIKQAYRGIQEAMPNSITVEMDIGESGSIRDDENEIISYQYDAGEQFISRETNCGGGMPFLGDAAGKPRSVRVVNDINGNGTYDDRIDIPVFRYFDAQGNQIPFASLPNRIPEIRRIEVTLAVETEELDPSTLQRRRMIYSSSATPRNHGYNVNR